MAAAKEALKERALSRSRSTPALRGLPNRASPTLASCSDGGSSNPSMHSADDVLVSRSSLPYNGTGNQSGLGPQLASRASDASGAYDGDGGRRLSWQEENDGRAGAVVSGAGEDSVSEAGPGHRGGRSRVTFTEEQEAASEGHVCMDFRPFLDLAPTTVRQATNFTESLG